MGNPEILPDGQKQNHFRHKYYTWVALQDLYLIYPSLFICNKIVTIYLKEKKNSLEKILILGKIKGKRSRGWQGMRWLDSIIDSMDMSLSKPQEIVEGRGAWHATVHRVTMSWTQLSDWITTCKISKNT